MDIQTMSKTTAPEMWPYQVDLWLECNEALLRSRRVLMQLPTGGGKSVILSEIATDWKQGRIYWATHRSRT